jgi:hypothetical protein
MNIFQQGMQQGAMFIWTLSQYQGTCESLPIAWLRGGRSVGAQTNLVTSAAEIEKAAPGDRGGFFYARAEVVSLHPYQLFSNIIVIGARDDRRPCGVT